MLPLKIFWSDMDKFPGNAGKIIDQSESFFLGDGGEGGGGGRREEEGGGGRSLDFPVV